MADDRLGAFSFETPVRLYYSNLFVPKAYTVNGVAQGAPKYDMQVLVNNDDPQLTELKRLALLVASQSVPAVTKEQVAACPTFKTGASILAGMTAKGKPITPRNQELLGDVTVVKASGTNPARLYRGFAGLPVMVTDPATPLFYTGALVLPTLFLKAYTGMGGGVHAYVNDILVLPGGERIASAPSTPAAWAGKIPAHVTENIPDDETF